MVRSLAAANSIASGMPSNARQTRARVASVCRSTPKSGRTEAARGERRLRDIAVHADRRELHQPDAVGEVAEQGPRGLGGEPGLPGAARADEGGQPMPGDEFADRRDVRVLADEAGQLGPQVV